MHIFAALGLDVSLAFCSSNIGIEVSIDLGRWVNSRDDLKCF